MNRKISVIIPVYNQLDYFKKCINSICNQTYRNLEIICVDDGSTDGVSEYLDKMASQDNRLIVIHQENKGESNARNTGLDISTGEYIAFADCDDWIEPEMYSVLLQAAENDDLDIVASAWYKETGINSIAVHNEVEVDDEIFNRDQFLSYIYRRDSFRGFAYMWNKLYRRDVLVENDALMKFDESLSLGGDVIYLAKAALKAKRVRYIDIPYYHYLIRDGSGSHGKDINRMKDWIRAYEMTINLLKENEIEQKTIDYATRFMAYHAMQGVEIAIEKKDDKAKKYFQSIMEESKEIYISLNQDKQEWIEQYGRLMKI